MERFGWLRRYISPVFLALLVASFILWYIAKLNYTYTTEQPFTVNVDGERFKVSCVVEGVGTNLFGYRVYMSKRLRIPLSELKFRSVKAEDGEKFLKIDSLSAQRHFRPVERYQGHLRRIGSRNSGSPSARKMIKVGITGGIGSGKSTVCRLFAACGAPVYDSDTQAKRLMEEDGPLRRRLAARFGEEIYAGGRLNRKLLAGRVFSDPAELSALNALVHPAVMEDFERWCGRQSGADYVVLESAILFEAGLEGYVDRTIAVTAPIDVRIARTCLRDGASAEEVRRRIAVQLDEEELRRRADYTLVNINLGELEYEVARLDKLLRDENRKHSA